MTSITLNDAVKSAYSELKPEALDWNEHLAAVLSSVEPERLVSKLDALVSKKHEEAVEKARARYATAKRSPSDFVSFEQARDMLAGIRAKKLQERLEKIEGRPIQSGSFAAKDPWSAREAEFRSRLESASATPSLRIEIDLGRALQDTIADRIRHEVRAALMGEGPKSAEEPKAPAKRAS